MDFSNMEEISDDGPSTDGYSMEEDIDACSFYESSSDASSSNESSSNESSSNESSPNGSSEDYSCNCGYQNISWDVDEILQGDEFKPANDLMVKLLSECGWVDKVRKLTREIWEIRAEGEDVNDVYREILPFAIKMVPKKVHTELKDELRNILSSLLDQQSNDTD
ncbi:hypothetical protein AWZ03_014294 [Drosophila navojoa]|uniref:Transcription and mRNA export factor SUS1 n=1 Tax=Drosophila navojoa TaxID=7232 RepID=A0A484AS96_DRONA|nr:hypothetical protein AWZ03_014294 [Drosophila navojoa]